MKTIRSVILDPDFRKNPKTDQFCWYCQKDLKDIKYVVYPSLICSLSLIHPQDKTENNSSKCFVGKECVKKIPKDYVVTM